MDSAALTNGTNPRRVRKFVGPVPASRIVSNGRRRGIIIMDNREAYQQPEVEEWGSVADLTQTGLTNEGGDAKDGSAASEGR